MQMFSIARPIGVDVSNFSVEEIFVRKMYDMYIDPRISLHDIATQLTAQGVRSFYGKPFSRSTP